MTSRLDVVTACSNLCTTGPETEKKTQHWHWTTRITLYRNINLNSCHERKQTLVYIFVIPDEEIVAEFKCSLRDLSFDSTSCYIFVLHLTSCSNIIYLNK